jgi:hypothetical protein
MPANNLVPTDLAGYSQEKYSWQTFAAATRNCREETQEHE